MGRRYLKCPDCNKFGVYVKFYTKPMNNFWRCRQPGCGFISATGGDLDRNRRERLREANPNYVGIQR